MSKFMIVKWGRVFQHGILGVYENHLEARTAWENFRRLHEFEPKTQSNQLDGYHIYTLVSCEEPRLEEYYTDYPTYEILHYNFHKSPLTEEYPYSFYLENHAK